MRTALAATLVLLVSASPALAQLSRYSTVNAPSAPRGIADKPRSERVIPRTEGFGRDLGRINDSIRNGRDSGQLSRREARALRREGTRIGGLQERWARGGLSASERAALRGQVEALRSRVVIQRSN